MERYSILDPGTPQYRPEEVVPPVAQAPIPEKIVPKPPVLRPSTSISAAIAAANAALDAKRGPALGVKFPGEDGGQSLAEMAERDLDAALQLLADRAQYITGATGAAIALRRAGRTDMLCRASSGSNAPGLGALLSAEAGLSGESVRTRTPLRCDDTERDPRVNRDGCRALGIASVIIMPIESDDQVLGVFELFSGKTNAFAERDLFALQRLAGMVKTAVKVTQPPDTAWLEKLVVHEPKAKAETQDAVAQGVAAPAAVLAGDAGEEFVLDEDLTMEDLAEQAMRNAKVVEASASASLEIPAVVSAQAPEIKAVNVSAEATPAQKSPAAQKSVESIAQVPVAKAPEAAPVAQSAVLQSAVSATPAHTTTLQTSIAATESAMPPTAATPKKPLFWTAAVTAGVQPSESSQAHVPAALRNLHKCQACNFPVSEGRKLCVECEEKKWRGQLRYPATRPVTTEQAPAHNPPPQIPSAQTAPIQTPVPSTRESKPVAPVNRAAISPAPGDPASIDPAKIDPAKIDPAKIDPAKIDLAKIDPVTTDPPTSLSEAMAKANASRAAAASAAVTPEAATPNLAKTSVPAVPVVKTQAIEASNYPDLPATAMLAHSAGAQTSAATEKASSASLSTAGKATSEVSSTRDVVVAQASTSEVTKSEVVESESVELPILSGGISSEQSWFSRNKYVLGALLVVGGVVAAAAFLR